MVETRIELQSCLRSIDLAQDNPIRMDGSILTIEWAANGKNCAEVRRYDLAGDVTKPVESKTSNCQ